MHGLRWRGLETERYATAPVPDPTEGVRRSNARHLPDLEGKFLQATRRCL
jgi:hypothetical protein